MNNESEIKSKSKSEKSINIFVIIDRKLPKMKRLFFMQNFTVTKRFRKILLIIILLFFFFQFAKHVLSGIVKVKIKKEFRIEFADLNIPYYYYGDGKNSCDENGNILIATLSRPNATDLRMAIRNSWKKDIPKTITQKFFVGFTKNETLQKLLKKESEQYEDIVFTNIIDSYLNLTLKMASVFQWQQYYCPHVKYFLRADEDTVLDVSRFQYWLDKKLSVVSKSLKNMVIFGHHLTNGPVLRDPKEKWYIPYEAYNQSYYPDYIIGASYLTTSYSIKLMLNETKNHKHVSVDDAFFTGIIAEALHIIRISSTGHFWAGNPLKSWNHICDKNGILYLFSISDEAGEIETVPNGYNIALENMKGLKCTITQ